MKAAPPAAKRRFPPPWRAVELDEAYVVYDATGHPLAYVYFEDEPVRRSSTTRMTRDEARRIASGIAKLPELIKATPADNLS